MTDGPPEEPASGLAPQASGPEPEPQPPPEAMPAPMADPNAELRDAVGARPRAQTEPVDPLPSRFDDDDEPPAVKRSRRTMMVVAASVLGGLTIAALIFLGRANAQRYVISCALDHVSAEQGRAFPPWGAHPLSGPEWRPITLAPNAECKERETEDEAELERWYLEILVDRASTALTARGILDTIPGGSADPRTANPLDAIAAQLDQALLLARAPDRRDQRKEVERLLGDVHYWRAAARMRDATGALLDAAKQFEAAATERPRHQTDAGAWASFLHKLGDDLHTGPNSAALIAPTAPANPEHPTAPPGTVLPVEPTPPPAAPDAGIPSGGVLL